jgi:sporulation protein YlmC with PRC-barrel domain
MRKSSLLLSTIVVLALLLTACGGQETTTSVPSTNVPPVTVESTGTEAPSATEAPTSAPGASDLTTTPGVPVTGENNPSRASSMMNMVVKDQNNTEVGKARDLVLDLDNTRVAYLVVQVSGVGAAGNKTVLVPWNSVQLQASADNAQENAFVLLADPNFLSNAPDTDINTLLPGMCQAAGNWDADIRNFWATGAMPSSTQSANTTSAGTSSTANATATSTTGGTGTNATATSTSGGTGTSATATTSTGGTGTGNTGTGNNQGQGVVLASEVLGTTVMIGGQSQGQGQGQGQATAVPDTTATATTGGTGATATASTGGTGTGQSADADQATVEDAIIDMATGDVQYLVINTANDTAQWIPVPVGFLRCDSATNGFSLTINANALQNAPAFAQDQFPDTSTTGWDTEFSTFWQNNGGTGGTGMGGTGTGVTASTATATP